LRLYSAGAFFHGLGGNDFNKRDHHGTAEERTVAIEEGYRLGREATLSFAKAIISGGEFVRRFS
jgi:hypothetical protein